MIADPPTHSPAHHVLGIDDILRSLDDQRAQLGMTKARLAELVGKNPSVVRRLFTADSANPSLATLASLAHALGGEVTIGFGPTTPAPEVL